MSDNSESTFQPHSDEELARLLEEQMRAMRSSQPVPAPQPVAPEVAEAFTPAPVDQSEVESVVEKELGIEELFGALLEDTTDIPVVQAAEVVEEEIFVPTVDESLLEHTQPIAYIHEEVTEVVEVEDQIIIEEKVIDEVIDDNHSVVEETITEVVIEDAHIVAERVLSEISIDGEIVATTIATSAGADPIPQMFGEAIYSTPAAEETIQVDPIPAAVMDFTPAETEVEVEEVQAVEELFESNDSVDEVVVQAEAAEEAEEDTPHFRSTHTINSFAPRPSFDELVFGVKLDD